MGCDLDILIVDDEPEKRELLMFAMQISGYRVRTADDGEAGFAVAIEKQPSLIISDAEMPGLDGFALADRVRSDPHTMNIPVIILGYHQKDLRRALEAGALGYVADPTDLDLILAWVRNLVDLKNRTSSESRATATRVVVDRCNILHLSKSLTSKIRKKLKAGDFDVFLCHNSEDKPVVKDIGKSLIEAGILPWLDEWDLRPGLSWQDALERQIGQIKSAAVFVGKNGIGPWQRSELNAFLREFVGRGCPVIPVLLPDAPGRPELPIFLQGMTWVDFRKTDPNPMVQLSWGITGKRKLISA